MGVDKFFDGARKRKRGGTEQQQTRSKPKPASLNKGKGRELDPSRFEHSRQQAGQRRRGRDAGAQNGDGEEDGSSEEDSELDGPEESGDEFFDSEEEQDARETANQKRLRLAQQYLDNLQQQNEVQGIDAAELERDLINERLQKDVLEVSGKLHIRIAGRLRFAAGRTSSISTKVHRLPVTAAVASQDCSCMFTASKDGSVARFDLSSVLKSHKLNGFLEDSQASTSASQYLQKTDFIPKRPSINKSKRKGQGKEGSLRNKGKPGISKNQPSQDAESRGHTDEIYSLAISSDGKRLASGGKDRRIGVWDISEDVATKENGDQEMTAVSRGRCRWLHGLKGHKDSISSLAFRFGTSQIYSSSFDRTVKIHDAVALNYIETLFGHQDKISSISINKNELAVTSGGRDKTLRYWKIKDESQLVFRAGGTSKLRRMLEGGSAARDDAPVQSQFVEGSVDCTAMVDDHHFLSGGDSGTVALWNITKKKAIFSVPAAHGIESSQPSPADPVIENPRWITSIACLPYSDLFCSGSWDGSIIFWQIDAEIKSFKRVGSIEAVGYVNSLQLLQLPTLSSDDTQGKAKSKGLKNVKKDVLLVAALGQEHRFARWHKVEKAKNTALALIIPEQE